MDKNHTFTKALKTPSPPAKIKLFLESCFDNFDRKVSTSGGSRTSCEQDSPIQDAQSNSDQPNGQLNAPNQPANGEAKLNQLNLLAVHPSENPQIINSCSKVQLNRTNDSLQSALKTEDFNCKAAAVSRPLSSESQRSQHRVSSAFRTRLGNTGDALTNIVKKYQNIQAQNKCSVVLDDSTDEDEPSATSDLSDTPTFNCSSAEEEEPMQEEEPFSSSQNTNSIESSSNAKKLVNKNLRPYKSEPQLSSFEDSVSISSTFVGDRILLSVIIIRLI